MEKKILCTTEALKFFIAGGLIFCASYGLGEEIDLPQEETVLPEVVVTSMAERGFSSYAVRPGQTVAAKVDTSSLLQSVPGAANNSNGTISGQTSYRGMFGPRMNVLIDGAPVSPGGPNWMDPPLHYVPPVLLDTLRVIRGIAPVSLGAESPGGTVFAESKTSRFGPGEEVEVHGEAHAQGRTLDEGVSSGGFVSLANDAFRVHLLGVAEDGRDIDFAGGQIAATQHSRYQYGAGLGFQVGEESITFDFRRNDTGETGTPSLPMDIIFLDSEFFRSSFSGAWGDAKLKAVLSFSDIDHQMNNFSVRAAPANPANFRFVNAAGRSLGSKVSVAFPAGSGTVRAGMDSLHEEHEMDVFNPNNAAFFVNNFNDVNRDRFSFFTEYSTPLLSNISFQIGVRYARVELEAGHVNLAGALPAPAQNLKNAFNAADRSVSHNLYDGTAKLEFQAREDLALELAVARKERAPSYIEQFAWLPLEVTSGLGDGNNHIGDLGLKPEVAYEFDFGADWRPDFFEPIVRRIYLSPRVFYNRVEDFITGVPADGTPNVIDSDVERVSNLNGDPTPLQYGNVDAEFYGIDVAWGLILAAHWHLDGTISHVRGRRRDIPDELFRVPPFNGQAALTYQAETWSTTAQIVFVARQDKLSKTNGEDAETPGYAILNLAGRWSLRPGLVLEVGLENVFDTFYRDHLSGFNRVNNSGVGLGDRLPGAGRNFFLSLALTW